MNRLGWSRVRWPATSHHNSNDHHADQRPTLNSYVELLADDPRRSSLNPDAHTGQRPTNLDPQNQVTPLSSSTSISAATLRRRSGFRVQWCLGFEVPSQWTLEGRSSNHEIERNRSYRKERRGKWERREKIEEKNKIWRKKKEKKWPLGIKKNNIWFNIYGTVSCYWWQLTVAVCQNFWHLKSLM